MSKTMQKVTAMMAVIFFAVGIVGVMADNFFGFGIMLFGIIFGMIASSEKENLKTE